MSEPVLSVDNLKISFSMYAKGFRKMDLTVIESLSLQIHKAEILAVVGSSGSGKSILAHAILGILPKNARIEGQIQYQGETLTPKRQQALRGREIALIPQSVRYLDPLMRVGKQVIGVKSTHEAQRKAFSRYALSPAVEKQYPFQLSGGMARRVLITTALTQNPALIVADEPTPGLSKELAMETLNHLKEFANDGAAVLLITHDIDLALSVADRIAVFYAGTAVEIAPVDDFKASKKALRHPYSKALMDALPQNAFKPIPGSQPYAGNLPAGCLFAPRCNLRTNHCSGDIPMQTLRGAKVRCIHAT